MHSKKRLFHFAGIAILFIQTSLTSCVMQRNVEYIRDNTTEIKTFPEPGIEDYRLKPNDELYIQITSLDDATTNVFTASGNQQLFMGSIDPFGASLISHTIDKDGNIILPVLGQLNVMGKTTSEVGSIITQALTNVLSEPMVSVKLVNRYVSILGEVRVPGHYPYTKNKFSVYDAISMAGDISEYGNRREVVIIRNEDGVNKRVTLDLTDSDILTSEYYYILPNDMVYVKPMNRKFWGLNQFPYSVVLSTVTTALLIYTVINPK